jgi:Xaa-Pro aminopeptidase
MSTVGIPRFGAGEIARRHEAARKLMDDGDLDGLLVFGHSGRRRHNQADVYYLTNVAPQHECYLLLPKSGEPALLVTHHNHLASAREIAAIDDVRRAGRYAAAVVAKEIKLRGLARLGVVGPVFYQDMDTLRAELPSVSWTDVSLPFKALRTIKSDAELAFQRRAAAACDSIITAFAREIRPGVEERDLHVLSEQIAWESGCEPDFLYLNSTPMAQSESCVPNQNISRRRLAMGDVVNTELTVSYGLYSAQILRPFFLGEPTAAYARLYEVTKAAYDRLAAAIAPGATARDVWEASGYIEEHGYTTVDSVLHGFGIDILPPNIRSKGFEPPSAFTFKHSMTVVLQPNPTTADEKMGLQLGGLGLIGETTFHSMHAIPAEVIRCG